MPHHSGGAVLRADGQFLQWVDHRLFLEAEDKEPTRLIDFGKQAIILTVVAVSHIGLTGDTHLPQRLPLAILAARYPGIDGPVLHQMKPQVQTHPFGLPGAPHAILGPRHARQRTPQTAILRHQVEVRQPGISFGLAQPALEQALKNFPQQLRIQHVLHGRETAEANRPATDFLLHSFQMAGLAKGAHGFDHRVEQSKQEQGEIGTDGQLAVRI